MAAGVCYRMWTKGEEGGLAAFPPAEIEAADLTGLALELAPEVRVNGIAPGAILWPESGASLVQQQAMIAATPLARMGEISDICQAAQFFIESAGFSTGQVLDVDGGRLLR